MALLVRNIKLALDEPEDRLAAAVAKRLKVSRSAIRAYAPVRRSLDARVRTEIHFVYHVEVALDGGQRDERRCVQRLSSRDVIELRPETPAEPAPGRETLRERPIIAGFGPAGMFAALRLTQFGYRPIVLERGVDVRRRHRDVLEKFYRQREFNPQSNLLFGEGGAGTYSDGKLYTRVSDPLAGTVLKWFYRHGADPDILTDARPHIGSDRLPSICKDMREHVEREGGQVCFESQVSDLVIEDGDVRKILVNGQPRQAGPVILAIGHSARDTTRMLHKCGLTVEPRPFQLGVRIEHPQALVDRWQYGQMAGHDRLPPAEYHVVAKGAAGDGRDCYSFCMCPGGMILPTIESHGLIATNGASKANRGSGFANSGLVVTAPPVSGTGNGGTASNPLAGIDVQHGLEKKAFLATGETYELPAQRATDFLAGRPSDGALHVSYPLGGRWTDIRTIIPPDISAAIANALEFLDRRMPGFAGADAIVTAPETRVSSPVRFPRDKERRTLEGTDNLYAAGEGAGYAGGIISAAIDGIKTADAIIARYAPPE